MLSETVNPANGSVNIKIPLTAPQARGLSLPVSLIYNSGSVHRFASGAAGGGQMIQDASSITSSGWGDSLPYASASFTQIALNNPEADVFCQFSSSYVFYGPSGDSHMLGLAGISYVEGQVSAGTGTSPTICGTYASPVTQGGDIAVTAQALATCNGFPPNSGTPEPQSCIYGGFPFVVTDEHSNVYNFPWPESSTGPVNAFFFPSTIEDRNGNITTFSVTPDVNDVFPASEQVTDSLGRVLVTASHTLNKSVGRNGQTSYVVGGLTYSVAYETVNANFSLTSEQITPPPSTVQCATSFSVPSVGEGTGVTLAPDNGVENVVQSITLPNGQQYTFEYNDPYGLISQINYPNGGWVKYTWKLSDTYSDSAVFDGEEAASGPFPEIAYRDGCNYYYKSPVLATREVGYSANSPVAQTQTFTYNTQWPGTDITNWASKTTTVQTTDDVTGKTAQTIYTYSSISILPPPSPDPPVGNPAGQAPQIASQIPVESSVLYYDWGNTTTPLETVNKSWEDIFSMMGEQDILPGVLNGESKETMSCYQAQDLLMEKDEYGWNQAAPALTAGCGKMNPFRRTVINYVEGQPCQQIVYNSSGTVVSEADGYTDGSSTPCGSPAGGTAGVSGLPAGTHDETNFGPSSTKPRGNITKLVNYLNTGGSDTETYMFDETGQVISSTDACGNTTCSDMTGTNHTTTYSYTDAPSGGNAAGNSNAYLTKIIDPLGHTASFTYNYPTGELASSTDANNQATRYTYNDPFDRLTQTNYPDGGQTTIGYNDSVPSVTTTQLMSNSGTPGPKISVATMDGIGHTIETQLTSDTSGVDTVATTYDGMGHAFNVTNPYRSTPNGSSTYHYDAMGRKIEAQEPDGSVLQWCYNGLTTYSGLTIYCNSHLGSVASGTWVDSTDEAGNHWQRTSDAFGRLTEVMEPNGVAQTASMETDYSYDALNNLLSVAQWGGASGSSGARARSFSYDSLSRLLSATNPETGTIGYSYDANGNVSAKTDARNVTTTSTYDALNRLTKKSYSDGVTPTSLFVYDVENITFGTPNFPTQRFTTSNVVGRLSVICVTIPSGCPSMTAYSYDPMGRIIETLNNTPTFPTTGAVYAVSATYDLAGDRTSLTNSTGRTFNYSYDAAGRLQTASNTVSLNGSPVTTPMVSSMTYFPSGQPQTMTTDTGSATITGTWGIDNRLRVTSYQNLSSANTAGTNYGYSLTYMPNSNVLTDAETVYNPASGAMSWSWNFGYDSLNRLTSAQSTGAVSFGCGWTYDGFGNRLTQAPSGTGLSCTSVSTPVNANNQLSNPIYSYDAAGDILTEGGNTLTYDAEGRIITGIGAFGTTTYDYGGDGMRVNKTFGSAATEYIHDPDGALVATYVNGSYFGNFQDMWVAGKHFGEAVVASGNASQTQNFSLNNWLGSLVAYSTPSSGIPNTAYISQPFGDAQTSLFGPNNNDDVHFTGKERDGESGNDYFGARYYASSMGRFMSPDWSAKAEPVPYAKLGDPQTLNLYGYMQNNPLGGVDQDGHCPNTFALGCNAFDNLEGDEENSANQSTPPPSAQQQPAQQQSPYQAGNREANVVYHETAALRPIPGQSDDGDLHDVRVDAAHVYNNVTNKSAFQDTGTLNAREQKDLAGGYPPGVKAYNDSVAAVNEAAHSADSTGGSKHFFVRDTTLGSAQRVPSWANGNQIVYGPFRTTANGDGGISKGDTIYIWINNTR
jgi:RHS repeat-associated protein